MSSKGPNPRAGASSGSEACTSTRTSPEEKAGPEVSIGNCAPNSSSTSSAQTSSKPTLPTRSSMSTPRYRSDPPSRSGSAIAVWNATTPSNPGTKSAPFAGVVVISDDLHIEDGNCGWELRGGAGDRELRVGNCRGATRSGIERWHSTGLVGCGGGQLLATTYWDTSCCGTFYRPVIWAVPSQC